MRRAPYWAAFFSLFLACSFICAQQARSQTPQNPHDDSKELVRDVIAYELDEQAKDQSLWCFRKTEEKDGKPQHSMVACQSKAGEIDRLVAINGHMLDARQQQEEDRRIQNLLRSPAQLRKQRQQQHEDAQQATKLLKMIPEAFLFTRESETNDLVKLKFRPNPNFRPADHEVMVFHHMEGTMILNRKQRRLAEISGRLVDAVKFGGGLLGHLDKGGTFLVKQEEIAPQIWEMTMMDVRMNGKALFFKTIAVKEKEVDTDFRPVPQGTTIQQAAALTREKFSKEPSGQITAKK
jgi:hypothetical protein